MKAFHDRTALVVVALLFSAAFGNVVMAQESRVEQPGELTEIVITAQKRAEPLQKAPISVSVLDNTALEMRNVSDLSQVADSVPSVAFATTGLGNSNYIIRGVGAVGAAQSPTTGMYLDETPLQSRSMRGASQADPQLYDIARVEVLRGPQGVLFGSSAMGGLVRIITNQPDATKQSAKLEGSAATITDGAESWDFKGMFNAPLIQDKLALRIVGSYVHQGGWIDDLRPKTGNLTENLYNPDAIEKDANWSRYKTVRASLRWDPSPTLSITPSVILQDAFSNTDRTFSDATFGLRARLKARYIDTYSKDKFGIETLVIKKDFDDFSLLSSSSYMDRKTHLFFDVSAYYSPVIEDIIGIGPGGQLYPTPLQDISHTRQFTQEIRMVSSGSGPLQYVAGAFYRNMDQDFERNITAANLFGATLPAPVGLTTPAIIQDTNTNFIESEVAAFGELTYAFADHFKLAVGAREFLYRQKEASSRYGEGGVAGGSLDFAFTERNKESGTTPRVTFSYEPSDAASLYASFSQGFRTGGVNQPITDDICTPAERQAQGLPDTPPPYKSDKTNNFEVGAKTKWLGGRLRIYGSVYKIDWKDYQQAFQTTCGDNNQFSVSFIVYGGEVNSKGGELEIGINPATGLNINAGVSYTNATYRNAVPQLLLPAGSRLLDVPRLNWNASTDYSFPLSGDLTGNVLFAGRHVGATNSGFGEGEVLPRPSYTLLDMSLGIKTARELTIDLFVDNLTDAIPVYGQEFATSPGNTTATSYFAYHVGPPRTVGLRLSKAF